MKRKLTLKSLLVAALVGMGTMSAWAEKTTLNPTGTTMIWGDCDGSKSDAHANSQQCYYDADATFWLTTQDKVSGSKFINQNTAWGGSYIVITKFDVASYLPEGISLTSAILKFNSVCTVASKNSNVQVALIGTDWDAETATYANTNTAEIMQAQKISEGDGINVGTGGSELSFDVKDYLLADNDKVIGFAIYTYTAREQKISNLQLIIETADASTQTTYTVLFTDGENNLKEPVVYDGTIGETAKASDSDKASFLNEDGTKRYIYDLGAQDITLDADASKNVITLVFREAEKYHYIVNGVDEEGSSLYEIANATVFEGEDATVPFPEFYLSPEGDFYKADKINNNKKEYRYTFAVPQDNTQQTVTYKATNTVGVIYYSEGENIEGMNACGGVNVAVRCSNAAAGTSSEPVTITNVPAGKYKIFVGLYDNSNNDHHTATFTVGNEEISFETKNVNQNEFASDEIVLDSDGAIIYNGVANANNGLDYIYVQAIPESYTVDVNYLDESGIVLKTEIFQAYKGTDITASWSKYIKIEDTWYVAEAPYMATFTEAGLYEVELKPTEIVDFIEMEATTYRSAGDLSGDENISNGKAVLLYSGSAMQLNEKVAAGTYDFSIYGYVRRANEDILTVQISADGSDWTDAGTIVFESSRSQLMTATAVTLAEDSYVRFLDAKGQNSCHYYDYLIITETPEALFMILDTNYETFSSKYPLDFSTVTGVKAYYATEAANDKVVMAPVNGAVNAMEGLFLQKIENGGIAIPVAGQGDVLEGNLLKAGNGSKVAASDETVKHYVLGDQDGIGFYNLADEVVVPEGKAYLEFNVEISTARLAIVFGNEATGISELKAEKNAETIYNLAGQRVVKAQKGLYIQNGMKYMVK